MKILAVIGSPRKGNSYRLTQKIEKRLKKLDEVDFEYLFLKDYDLGNCAGCRDLLLSLKGEVLALFLYKCIKNL